MSGDSAEAAAVAGGEAVTVVGIDSSLTALGLCAIPDSWEPNDWKRITARTVVTRPGSSDVIRFDHLASCVASFCDSVEADYVYIEDALVYRGNTKRLCKLSGAIELAVWRECHIEVVPVPVSSARKLLLGSVPRGELAKTVVLESLRSLGGRFEDDAQSDAFCVGNFGRSEMGLWCVTAA